ncbi:MAG: glutamate-1-semialdehyde-2,1-aminomutase [Crocinitomicaceae bacterium]|nr:glutamate-1-semialdehyde-2,1-aminomutase [Crocinitomicaceae bacterium]|tara:strand:- start:7200 stop:8495 length:1296 start_codon:yes stop_codon:yes gene_type:complete
MKREISDKLYSKAKTLFPGGVNSPVRAFKSVKGDPVFIDRGEGSKIWDVDGNQYIDFCCSWGPLILGHNHGGVRNAIVETLDKGTSFGAPTALENELGDLIVSNNRFIEKIRFVNSGTEAVMSAIRLARGYTGKNKILKFEGCYHGHTDALLVNAGSGLVTLGNSSSAGIPEAFVNETLVAPLNNREAIEAAIREHGDDLACIIIEPIPANNGLLIQDVEYLNFLRDITRENDILLIFDEVISGFRVGFEGAAGLYNIQPDILTYGKIIGGGLPVGAYASSEEIMGHIAPDGPVYQAGTLSGNPVAMRAGIATLKECLKPNFYKELANKTQKFVEQVTDGISLESGFHVQHIGSIYWLSFSSERITKASEIEAEKMSFFKKLYELVLENGVYLGPSGYEVGFVSSAHSDEDLTQAAQVLNNSIRQALDNEG